jgi:hypothetical protein
MKRVPAALISILLCSTLAAAQSGPDLTAARITPDERARAVKLLLDTNKEFFVAVEKLSDAQWSYKPSPFRWSVAEVAEHIMLTEAAIFSVIQRALAGKPNPDWEAKTAGKDQLVERLVAGRVGRVQAPVEIRPSGKMGRDEVMRRFKEGRDKVMGFAEHTSLPLKAHTYDNPFPVFNTLNAYDWLLYIPSHTVRHLKQIAEIKAGAGFPN